MSNRSIVEKINDAFADNDVEAFLAHCTDDIVFEMVGHRLVRGKDNVRSFMAEMSGNSAPKFTVERLFEEGDFAVCSGEMEMEEDGSPSAYSYCDMYKFRDGKASELRAFVIKHHDAGEDAVRAAA
jgi:uncharacterized protein